MKRLLAVISAVLLMLCLGACKKNGSNDNVTTTTSTTIQEEEASHVAKKMEDGRLDSFNNYSDEDKEKIKEYAEKDGYTLVYNEDGSGTLSNEEGTWFVGKGWVDNEYTDGVPPIDFGKITMSSEYNEDENYYIFLVKETSADRTAQYVEAVKNAGFKEIGENNVIDVDSGIVSFTGENESGKHIEIGYSSMGLTVRILLNSN